MVFKPPINLEETSSFVPLAETLIPSDKEGFFLKKTFLPKFFTESKERR